ncbi:MAG: glutathione S-transferase family protein [Pseudomonadota bacterium]
MPNVAFGQHIRSPTAITGTMTASYRLHYAPDNASLIVRLVLDELGLAYETVLVDRRTRAQKSPAFLALNPSGRIPVLETGDGPIFETAAILLWLADRHGRMAPALDNADRAAFLKWLFFVSNTFHAEMRLLFYPETYVGADSSAQIGLRTQVKETLADRLGSLESLAATHPAWFGADEPSVFDYYICACLRWLGIYPMEETGWFNLGLYPNLGELAVRTETRAAVRRAIEVEGLGPAPFTAPQRPTPPEGSAL